MSFRDSTLLTILTDLPFMGAVPFSVALLQGNYARSLQIHSAIVWKNLQCRQPSPCHQPILTHGFSAQC
jgi:hypothetical protein